MQALRGDQQSGWPQAQNFHEDGDGIAALMRESLGADPSAGGATASGRGAPTGSSSSTSVAWACACCRSGWTTSRSAGRPLPTGGTAEGSATIAISRRLRQAAHARGPANTCSGRFRMICEGDHSQRILITHQIGFLSEPSVWLPHDPAALKAMVSAREAEIERLR